MKSALLFFDHEEKEMVSRVESFHKNIIYLKSEGKVRQEKNIKAARKSLQLLIKTLNRHHLLQEEIIFPYLLVHIPKYESMIRFLRSDHQDIHKNKVKLNGLLQRISRNSVSPEQVKRIDQLGAYLVCLVGHHVELEKENIYKAIQKELRKDEKKEVNQKVNAWFKSY